jgi:hypothetical protein
LEGDFEGLLGFILKQQYDRGGDVNCLQKSLLHFNQAYELLKQAFCQKDIQYIADHIAGIESVLQTSQKRSYILIGKNL